MLRAALTLAFLLGCARPDAPRPSARAPRCEHLPTDVAVAKVPYADAVTWSGDGSLVAAVIGQTGAAGNYVEGADSVVVWSVADGVVRKRYRLVAQAIAFAHEGERLAFGSMGESGVVDLRTDCAERWSRAGPLLAWGAGDRTLLLAERGVVALDPATGSVLREWLAPERDVRLVSMDAAPAALVLGDEDHRVRIVSADLSRAQALSDDEKRSTRWGNARAVAIAPNGAMVASTVVEEIPVRYPPNVMPGPPVEARFYVRIRSLPEGQIRGEFPGDAEALAFSPDSASLATAGKLDTRLIVRALATNETRTLDAKTSFPQQIAWSPDGRSIALADWRGAVRIYDARGGAPPRVLPP